ncbi:MAG: beta-ketoacyl synthase chain length factor, partial [Bdellovibrionales bacterium]|nr:beta-ketoacyl synthase chain length factor [Bdellovibrionales bacterium]
MAPGFEPEYDPQLRKATPMMKMIIAGMKALFNEETGVSVDPQCQLILSSRHGELSPTFDYLKESAIRNWTRPYLFQNSLHHSTTGFISQYFQILGPAYSVCGINNAEESAISLGLTNMMMQQQPTLLIHAEFFPEELVPVSDFEAIRVCKILYSGQKTVQWDIELHPTSENKDSNNYFKDLADAVSQRKESHQIQLSGGPGFNINLKYS